MMFLSDLKSHRTNGESGCHTRAFKYISVCILEININQHLPNLAAIFGRHFLTVIQLLQTHFPRSKSHHRVSAIIISR